VYLGPTASCCKGQAREEEGSRDCLCAPRWVRVVFSGVQVGAEILSCCKGNKRVKRGSYVLQHKPVL
jgi:hypothetical protein